MVDQTVILVDKFNKRLGYAPKEEAHTGRGRRHRAFVTLLFDRDNNVLLQRRKHRLFDNLWDLTAISHPLHLKDRDESYQEASDRALLKEMGIGHVPIRNVGGFNYFAKHGPNCENEYCSILVGDYDGRFKMNRKEVYKAKWVKFENFLVDTGKNAKDYTPWAILTAKGLKNQDPNIFNRELANFLASYAPYAKTSYAKKVREAQKYSPVIANLYKDLYTFSEGGKKLRAYFVWIGYQIGGGRDFSAVLPISFAFEMTQNFLLIHDDVMDNSDVRRGKPTIHKIYEKRHGKHYGESMAILLGDIAAIEVFKIISDSKLSDERKVLCQHLFAQTLLDTAYGQGLDIEYSFRKPTFDQIMQIAELKSGRYSVVAPLTIGAKLSGARASQLAALSRYGTAIGLVFQIADDILGVFGEEKALGKSTLSDMREGKNTLLIHKAKQMANPADRVKIERIWGRADASSADLSGVKKILESSGALLWCQAQNLKLIENAKGEIKKITTDKKLQQTLSQIADFVVNRSR
ncbi:MAG: polyprenyl synthetase family protein [Candidatus Curtissbacteria bacterium]